MRRLGVERGLILLRTHKLSYFVHIARHGSLQKTVLTDRIDDIKEWPLKKCYRRR